MARKTQALKDVVENHEAMERRKREIGELEKRAADLQKQAADLRKEADKIKKGK
jgi:prefoldin subunit 5